MELTNNVALHDGGLGLVCRLVRSLGVRVGMIDRYEFEICHSTTMNGEEVIWCSAIEIGSKTRLTQGCDLLDPTDGGMWCKVVQAQRLDR